jgi:phage regulator Rha-like protein
MGEEKEEKEERLSEEFIGQVIGIFEDFLDKRKVILDNSEITAVIFGPDRDELHDDIKELIKYWKETLHLEGINDNVAEKKNEEE